MLADGADSALSQALHECEGELSHSFSFTVERTITDDAAVAMIDVQHGSEAQVHTVRAQLGRQHETDLVREMSRVLRIAIPHVAQSSHGRDSREARSKTLHAPAFVIY